MRLCDFRKGLSMTKLEMAASVGFSLSMYEKVEDGRMKPTGNFMRAFKCRYPNASVDEIFFSSDSIQNANIDQDSA